jgi:hypothetical protein
MILGLADAYDERQTSDDRALDAKFRQSELIHNIHRGLLASCLVFAARAHPAASRPPFLPQAQGCPGKLKYARERRVFVFCTTIARHGWACPGHPRRAAATNLRNLRLRMGVDARHKAGHDAQGSQQGITSQPILFSRTALPQAREGMLRPDRRISTPMKRAIPSTACGGGLE